MVKMTVARIGRFHIVCGTAVRRFRVFKRLFERFTFAPNRLPLVRGTRFFDYSAPISGDEPSNGRILKLCFGQDGHETPPRATRDKPGRCNLIAPDRS
jgi:hypothetical protein